MKVLYTAQATARGGRDGRIRSSDGALNLELAIPKELGGPGGLATNPEQLLAAGFAACFENAVRLVARRSKVSTGDSSVTARVGIGANDAGGFQLQVELDVQLPDVDQEQATAIVSAAHQVCPFSNAVRGNVEVVVAVVPAPEVI
jgi:osmotically inducible protein OsmC